MTQHREPEGHDGGGEGTGSSAYLSFAPIVGTLTVTFGASPVRDQDFLSENLVAVFDSTKLGELLKMQALSVLQQADGWHRFLFACLGPTVADRCRELIRDPVTISHEEIPILRSEWEALRYSLWPTLHESVRSWLGRDQLPRVRAPASPPSSAISRLREWPVYVVPAAPESGPATFELPADVAETFGVEPLCELAVRKESLQLVVNRTSAFARALEARVVEPRMVETAPVKVHARDKNAPIEIPLHIDDRGFQTTRVLLVLAQPTKTPARKPPARSVVSSPRSNANWFSNDIATIFAFFDLGADHPLHGMRQKRAEVATSNASVEVGRTADRLYWKGSGKTTIEVVVLRQDTTLWARGFVKKSRIGRTIEIQCALNAEAHRVLRPRGADGAEGPLLMGQGPVETNGFFQVKLADVATDEVEGEFVAAIELRLRRSD